jgi:hypothetical protein
MIEGWKSKYLLLVRRINFTATYHSNFSQWSTTASLDLGNQKVHSSRMSSSTSSLTLLLRTTTSWRSSSTRFRRAIAVVTCETTKSEIRAIQSWSRISRRPSCGWRGNLRSVLQTRARSRLTVSEVATVITKSNQVTYSCASNANTSWWARN